MLSSLVSFGLGLYAGLYAAQNYKVTKVDEPGVITESSRIITITYVFSLAVGNFEF